MEYRIEPLNEADIADLEAKRTWVRDHYAEDARWQCDLLEGKLRLLKVILENQWIAADEKLKLQCLGVVFGDALAQRMGLRWVAVEDQLGRAMALTFDGTSIRVFPLTMISKRIERGETVDVHELFEGICGDIERIRSEAGPYPGGASQP